MRRMSFALTIDAVRRRAKTVTRRAGWAFLKPGDRLLAVDRIRSRNAQKLAVIEVVSVTQESLLDMHESDVAKEGVDTWLRCEDAGHHGFPSKDCTTCFFELFVEANRTWAQRQAAWRMPYVVTRIEFRYVEAQDAH
jgi:hypothetical protein